MRFSKNPGVAKLRVKIRKGFLVMILIVALSTQGAAIASEPEPVVLNGTVDKISFCDRVSYIEDMENKLTIDQVSTLPQEWKTQTKKAFGFGFSDAVYWFKFTINNPAPASFPWFLEISYAMLDSIRLYIPLKEGGFTVKETGDHLPFSHRDVNDKNFIFSLNEAPGKHTYYMRVETTSSVNFSMIMWSTKGDRNRLTMEMPVIWIFYGLMIIMLLYNFFIFISVREISYIYYVVFILGWIFFQMTLNGYAFQYLWPNSIWWANNCLPFFMSIINIFGGLFLRSFLQTRENSKTIDTFILIFIMLPSAILTAVSLLAPYRIAIKGATFFSIVGGLMHFVISILLMLRGFRPARFYFTAFCFLLIGLISFALKTFGLLPVNFFTIYSVQFGQVALVLLFSLGLADRINVMRGELKELNTGLEIKVKERTDELLAANQELTEINDRLAETSDALWGEMELAKKIQTVLLPTHPEIEGYEVSAYMKAADEVGGDYYDIITIDKMSWMVIGDVSGHGVPAGLIMMMAQTAIRTALYNNPNMEPSKLLTLINRALSDNIKKMSEDKYMTLTVLATFQQGRFCFSGLHQDIMIYRASRKEVELVPTTGVWIGIIDDIGNMNTDETILLEKEDVMLMYTDGLTEAWKKGEIADNQKPARHLFGEERLQAILISEGYRSPEEMKNAILLSLKEYQVNDDVTLLIIKRT